jgi:hypothetical protein
MHLIATALFLTVDKAPLFLPQIVFPIIAACIFLVLALITWSYRDVANRHANKAATQYHDDHQHGQAGHGGQH